MKHRIYYLVSRSLKEVFKDDAPGITLAISKHQVGYPKPEFGDYASNVALIVSKMYPQLTSGGPQALAERLASEMRKMTDEFTKIEPVNGFINFTLSESYLLDKLSNILTLKDKYGHSNVGENITVVVEYLSPNTNKPLHLGHIRNGVLGMSLVRLLLAQEFKTVKTSIVNDRGIHICKSMLAWKKWGNGETPQMAGKKGDHFVGDWYVRFAKEEKVDPGLLAEAQDMLLKWEKGDPETRALWNQMKQWVLEGFAETYKVFGFSFDKEYFESEVYEQGKTMVAEGQHKGVFRKNEAGNIIFDLPHKEFGEDEDGKPRVLTVLRADGTSLYVTQDLGLAVRRNKEYNFNQMVYVVGSEQKFHFQSLFAVLKKIGFPWAEKLHHLSYGMVYLPEGKMKSREGTVVDADDLLEQMEQLAGEEIKKRTENVALSETELKARARMVALGAIKFFFLRNRPSTDIHFDPKESISFEGFTGPYLQYSHARIFGILRKGGDSITGFQPSVLKGYQPKAAELAVVRKLYQFPEIMESAAVEYLPSVVCKYLFELAQSFNSFYQTVSVLSETDEDIKNFRLNLIKATAQVLQNGLIILGIEAPEEM